ncbi:pyridoxamine 5'-phosphate oxidase family protein [Candidatus Auribacterota bacterium]
MATSNKKGEPNLAPKFFLKQRAGYVYLIDYALGKTVENIKKNPTVAISGMDVDTLLGYKMTGKVQIIGEGAVYKKMIAELRRKAVVLSARRIAEGVRRQRKHKYFELSFPENALIYKIKIREVIEIGPSGHLNKMVL